MSESGYIYFAVILAVTGVFGFIMNSVILFVIIKDSRTLWTPINVILVNRTIQDLLVVILGNPLAFISAIHGKWYWSSQTCVWYAWLMSTLGFGSIGSLTVLAVERWVLVMKSIKSFSINTALLFAGFVWIYSLSMSLPPLFGWGYYKPEAGNISCSVAWDVHDFESHNRSFIVFIFIMGLVVPVTIIIASYTAIIYILKNMQKRLGV